METVYNYKFDNMSAENYDESMKEKFFEMYDGTLISKEPFEVEISRKKIGLHLYIEHIDMSEFDDTTDHIISIGVIPTFKSLTKKHQEDILSQYDDEYREQVKNSKEALLEEVKSYGYNITLHSVTVHNADDVEHVFNSAIAVSPCVSGLIGFDLDHHVNKIGNTGWDFLDEYCSGADIFKRVLKRIKGV